ncbi:MAG: 4-hydroxy-tetrahydrodipicolinate reductase, partial [Verrucomicrobia bacterium]|nr:4-hydroxy-tetrahydrodipicolinate reductase [Verrucomicrobiota bacterium]
AHTRDAFAKGALAAAEFIVQQPPGLYSIKDLFNS